MSEKKKSSKKKVASFFADSQDVWDQIRKSKPFKIHVKTPLGIGLRTFCFISVEGKRILADVITGSFYSTLTGYCMSTQQLQLVSNEISLFKVLAAMDTRDKKDGIL